VAITGIAGCVRWLWWRVTKRARPKILDVEWPALPRRIRKLWWKQTAYDQWPPRAKFWLRLPRLLAMAQRMRARILDETCIAGIEEVVARLEIGLLILDPFVFLDPSRPGKRQHEYRSRRRTPRRCRGPLPNCHRRRPPRSQTAGKFRWRNQYCGCAWGQRTREQGENRACSTA